MEKRASFLNNAWSIWLVYSTKQKGIYCWCGTDETYGEFWDVSFCGISIHVSRHTLKVHHMMSTISMMTLGDGRAWRYTPIENVTKARYRFKAEIKRKLQRAQSGINNPKGRSEEGIRILKGLVEHHKQTLKNMKEGDERE